MVKTKNILNLNQKSQTFNKSITSRRPVDGIPKNEKVSNIEKPISKSASSLRMANEMVRKGNFIKKENVKVEKEIIFKKEDKIIKAKTEAVIEKSEIADQTEEEGGNTDNNKRLFLKVAGIAGLGLAASALFPKGADAYVSGSTPTSNVVGIKNVANTKINPATEDTLGLIKTNSDKLTFDTGSNLKVAGNIGVKNSSDVAINPATEETLALIKNQTDKLAFDSSNNLKGIVAIKDTQDKTVNPATDDSVLLLRRIVKLMESQAVVDTANRQKVTVDSLGSLGVAMPVSGTVTVGSITTGTIATVSTVTNIGSIAGQNQQMYQDVARTSFATGIRNNLLFS